MTSNFFETTIGDQLTLQRGFDITKKQQKPGIIPVVSSGGVSSFHNEFKVKGPGVVLGRKGSLGTVFFIESNYWPHDTSLWVKDFKGNNPRFVYYFFKNISKILKDMDVGAANPALNRNHVHLVETKWPIRIIQDYIVEVLSKFDKKIENNNQTNQTLEQIVQVFFKSWFVDFDPVKAKIAAKQAGASPEAIEQATMCAISGKTQEQLKQLPLKTIQQLKATAALFPDCLEDSVLGEIPNGWMIKTFGDVSKCFDSKRIPLSKKKREEKKPGSIPYHGATSIMDYINEWIFDDIFLLLGEDGSVIKEDGNPFIQYIWGKTWVNNHAHVLQGKNGVSTEQLKLFIQIQNISAYITGAVQLKLNQRNMNSIPFIYAGEEINSVFYDYIKPSFAKIRNTVEENLTLETIRDALLPKFLSGELNVDKV